MRGGQGPSYLARVTAGEVAVEPVLVHDPLGLLAAGGSASVEDERLLHAEEHPGGSAVDLPVLSCGFPVTSAGGPVRPETRRVLAVSKAEEVPLSLAHLCHLC